MYWLTNTGVSAARLYWENKASFFGAKRITIPFAISVFPDELYQAPRSWAERAYPRTSSTTTGSTGAATSPPGNSPASSPPRCGPPSGHRANRGRAPGSGELAGCGPQGQGPGAALAGLFV